MSVLSRYLFQQCAAAVLLVIAVLGTLVWGLQAMRLGHHLVGAELHYGELLRLIGCSLPTLIIFSLPYALVIALPLVWIRLRAAGELQAMHAAGASPRRLSAGPAALVGCSTALAFILALLVEPPALERLSGQLKHTASRALFHRIQPQTFHRLGNRATLYAQHCEHRSGDSLQLRGLFLAMDSPPRIVVAQSAEARLDSRARVRLSLQRGELHTQADGLPMRMRFGAFEQHLATSSQLERHFAFVARMASPWRPWAHAATCLAFGLLALASAALLPRAPVLLAVCLLGVAGHEIIAGPLAAWAGIAAARLWSSSVLALVALVLLIWRGR